jgi:lysophospholipase L1-like esterase
MLNRRRKLRKLPLPSNAAIRKIHGMNSLFSIRNLLLASVLTFSTLADHSAVTPAPRGDQAWKTRADLLNQRVKENQDAQLLFIGDSITQGWEGQGAKEVWEKYYGKRKAVNIGIGGDRTQHVLYRLQNGNLEGIKPKAAVVMIGTNNSNGEDNSVEQIADGVKAIVKELRTREPQMKILLLGIFPRGENPNPQRGKVAQVNQIIQKLDDGKNVFYLDIGHRFLEEDGTLSANIMPDYLHLTPKGYEIWAEAIEPKLAELFDK